MSRDPFISFPPKILTQEPQRVPVLWNQPEAIALNKPAGLAAFQDSRFGGGPRSLLVTINQRASTAAQFEKFGIESVSSVHLLDRDASGVLIFAKNSDARTVLKNAFGSLQFVFRYQFFSEADADEAELVCDLPVAIHREKPLALISHSTGKKTVTRFRRIEQFQKGALWESESSYDRFHQVRLHASEAGIPVVGDPIYSVQKESRRIPFALHLASITFPWEGKTVVVEAPAPPQFKRVLRNLGTAS